MIKRIIRLVVFMLLVSAVPVLATEVRRMSTEDLNSRLSEDGLVIVDARSGRDWRSSSQMVAGAMRGNPGDILEWESRLTKDQTIVLYCT